MKIAPTLSLVAIAAAALAALAAGPQPAAQAAPAMAMGGSATATLQSPDPKVSGTVTFTQSGGIVRVVADVAGAKPGEHGFHLHEKGVCTPPDFKSAGGHWNPGHAMHGCMPASPRHAGDMGNITVGSDGRGHLEVDLTGVPLEGPDAIVGKAVVLHGGTDDCKTQPTGNAGDRLACGVVVASPAMAH